MTVSIVQAMPIRIKNEIKLSISNIGESYLVADLSSVIAMRTGRKLV
jgi:hypothetical protein